MYVNSYTGVLMSWSWRRNT